jgi:DNA-binding transcriptional LysR family regulator
MLSPEGRAFLTRARNLVDAQSALAAERRQPRRTARVHLRLSVGPLLMERCIKPGIASFYEQNPNFELEFVPFNPAADGSAAVRRGDIDLLLCTGAMPDRNEHVETEVLARVGCSIYGTPTLVRPVLQSAVPLSSLPFLLPPDHFRITQWAVEQFARHGVHPAHVVARPPFMDVLLQMVLAGKGVGLFFDTEVAQQLRAGLVLACGPEFDPAARTMVLGQRARSPEAAPLLEFLRRVVKIDNSGALQQEPLPARNLSAPADRTARVAGL